MYPDLYREHTRGISAASAEGSIVQANDYTININIHVGENLLNDKEKLDAVKDLLMTVNEIKNGPQFVQEEKKRRWRK